MMNMIWVCKDLMVILQIVQWKMVSTDDLYYVAVIDEIQIIADPCRGYAWTEALLGLKADEIHLYGDLSVLSICLNDLC